MSFSLTEHLVNNMNNYKWSASNNAFFPVSLLDSYITAGWDLSDAIDIPDDVSQEFMGEPPDRMIRVAGDGGLPTWSETPPATHEQEVAAAEQQKQLLTVQANAYMNSKQWPGKAAMGRLTDSEKAQYNAWLDYLDTLEIVDTSTAPDINWPIPLEA